MAVIGLFMANGSTSDENPSFLEDFTFQAGTGGANFGINRSSENDA
jgi:hypothetical protein